MYRPLTRCPLFPDVSLRARHHQQRHQHQQRLRLSHQQQPAVSTEPVRPSGCVPARLGSVSGARQAVHRPLTAYLSGSSDSGDAWPRGASAGAGGGSGRLPRLPERRALSSLWRDDPGSRTASPGDGHAVQHLPLDHGPQGRQKVSSSSCSGSDTHSQGPGLGTRDGLSVIPGWEGLL